MRRAPPAPGVIIERPDLQSLSQRFGFFTLTFLGWVIYGYLWLPLITLIAWQLDLGLSYERMVVEEGYRALAAVGRVYLIIFSALAGVYLAWAQYNLWRFRGRERRLGRPPCTLEEVAGDYNVPTAVLRQWLQSRRMVVHLDENGAVVPSARVVGLMAAREASATVHRSDRAA